MKRKNDGMFNINDIVLSKEGFNENNFRANERIYDENLRKRERSDGSLKLKKSKMICSLNSSFTNLPQNRYCEFENGLIKRFLS